MKQKETQFPDRLISGILFVCILIYGAACIYLYYRQLFFTEGGRFESDLPFHVSMAVEDHWFYSLTACLYQLFYLTPWGKELTALFLGAITAGTVFATAGLFRQLTQGTCMRSLELLFAFFANVMMPFYLPWAHSQRYIGYESASIWHNSTYLCMKLLAVLTFIQFLKLSESYREKLTIRQWLSFALLLTLCNGVKPSFCLFFAPVMAVFLLVDLCRGVAFKRVFLFGTAVLPSLAVILWQKLVLFGEDTGNGILIRPGYALFMRGDHPKVTFILSLAFPLFVLLFTMKDLLRDRTYRFTWGMWLAAFLEVFLFTEAGNRSKDSNFFWGYSMAIFFVNLLAMGKLLEKSTEAKNDGTKKWSKLLFTVTAVLCLSYQVWCGLFFFGRLLTGESYWM